MVKCGKQTTVFNVTVKSPFSQLVIYPEGNGFTACNIFRRTLCHLLSPRFSNAYSTSHLCAMKVIVCLVVEWEMFCRKAFRKSGRYCIKKDSAEEIFLDKWISHTAVMWASSVCVLHVGFTFHFYVVLQKNARLSICHISPWQKKYKICKCEWGIVFKCFKECSQFSVAVRLGSGSVTTRWGLGGYHGLDWNNNKSLHSCCWQSQKKKVISVTSNKTPNAWRQEPASGRIPYLRVPFSQV